MTAAEGRADVFAAAACTGKERFDSFELAHHVLSRNTRKTTRRQAYRCQHCGGFHLGTPTNRKRPGR